MKPTVLIIEDNEQNRYLLRYLLERHGYSVECAVDGRRGVELAQSLEPGVILLDIQLPAMDGYAVARALRAHEALRRTHIIAVTSYAMPGDQEKALASGCDGYIEKPIDPGSFIATMERMLQPRQSGRP
jgi:two-component system, cell cycle response regulator DivK